MEQNGHKAQEQIAKLWGEEVTQQNVRDAVKKLRITGKKTYVAFVVYYSSYK